MLLDRNCLYCGEAFSVRESYVNSAPNRGLYCSVGCANRGSGRPQQPKGDEHYAWRGDEATSNSKRRRARRLYGLGGCERCDAEAADRHHVDGNTGNNRPENIQRLCRRCHMEVDGRLDALIAATHARPLPPPSPCVNCGRLTRRRWYGKCGACNEYLRRNGQDRPAGGARKRAEGPCQECGEHSKKITRGMCHRCYMRWFRARKAAA